MTTAAEAKALQAQFIADLNTTQGPKLLEEIYGIIEQVSNVGQNKCEVAIYPALKNYILDALFADGYTLDPSTDGTRLWIIWE